MGILVWLSAAVFVAALVGGTVVAVRRAVAVYRDFRRLAAALGDALADVAAATEPMPAHLDAAARSGERLAASLERLRVSLARAALLRSAFAGAVEPVRGARRFRK